MFRRIFGRKPKPPPSVEAKELSLDSIEAEIRKLKDSKVDVAKGEMRPLVESITMVCEDIRASAKILAQAEASKEVYVGLDKSSREARRLFVDKVTRAIEGLDRSKEMTWPSLLAFEDSLNRTISQLTGAGVVHARYASVLFAQHFQNVYQSIHKLQELGTQFRAAIEVKKDEIRTLDDTSAQIAQQKDTIQKIADIRSQKEALENRAKSLENLLKSEAVEFDKLRASQEMKDAEKVYHELEQMTQNIGRLKAEAASTVSGLQRPFKKMKKLALDGKHPLSREWSKMIDLCIDEPLGAFLSDDRDLPILTSLIRELKGAIDDGEVELNPRERRKRLEQIQSMLSGELLELRREYDKILEEKAGKEQEYTNSSVLKQRSDLERLLKTHRSEQEKIQSDLKILSEDIEKTEAEIVQYKSKIENEASKFLGFNLRII